MTTRRNKSVPEALNNEPNAVFITREKNGSLKEWPYRRRELPQQLRELPIYFALQGWLQQVTLDQVIDLWYQAQGLRFDKQAEQARQLEELKRRFPEQYENLRRDP